MTLERRAVFLDEMGIGPLWQRRDMPVATETPAALEPMPAVALAEERTVAEQASVIAAVPRAPEAPPSSAVAGMNWMQLKESVAGCVKCGLCNGRTKTVFGVGDEKAKWLFIGEGPGRNEDQTGEPFVGPAGKLLDNMLRAIGVKRGENAYIANIVKCRPTDGNGRDRPPTQEETAACMPYLERQIALIQPTVLVALGKTAALSLLGLDPETPVSKLRGTVHRYAGLPLVVTYHPAYLLRSLPEKRKAWTDLCLAMTTYANA
ncbi:uracil-DNA glycosylase [Noviherbaspirillum sp. ST9]|uniref:uracil-DNA glycosylase n=1 Tax=Noviherbaspirillum sp. ST9 TaxID=3401606 RepID=UPI003B589DE1